MSKKIRSNKLHPLIRNNWRQLLIAFLILISLITSLFFLNQPFHFFSKAATGDPDIFFEPQSVVLPPNSAVKLFLNTKNQPLGFVHLELNFDPSKINLTQEITPSSYSRIIKKSTMAEANLAGKIILILAAEPGQPLPTGTVQIAQFAIKAKNKQTTSTNIALPTTSYQRLISTSPEVINFNTLPLTISLNPKAPKPTRTPKPRKSASTSLQIESKLLVATPKNKTYSATVTVTSTAVPDSLNVEVTNLPKGMDKRPCSISYTATHTIATCRLEGSYPQGGLSRIKVSATNGDITVNRSIPLFVPRICCRSSSYNGIP